MASTQFNLYEAKTQLSSLVERAAKGEDIVIAKSGKPLVKMVPVDSAVVSARVFGRNLLGVTHLAEDFDAPLQDEVLRDFGL